MAPKHTPHEAEASFSGRTTVRTGRRMQVKVWQPRCPCCEHRELVEARNRNGQYEPVRSKEGAFDLDTGLMKGESTDKRFPLPFKMPEDELETKLRIGAGFSDYQRYEFAMGSPYVHAGIDFRVPKWTPVHAVSGGDMEIHLHRMPQHCSVNIYEVGAGGERTGRRFEYAHLDPDYLRRMQEQGRDSVSAGSMIGVVAEWFKDVEGIRDQIDVCDGKLYSHLHLNMVVTDPEGLDHYYNVLKYMDFPDEVDPTILKIHLVQDGTSQAFAGEIPVLSGKVDVVIEAYDRTSGWRVKAGAVEEMEEGAPFRLGLYRATVRVDPAGGGASVFDTELPAFDQMKSGGAGGFGGELSRAVYLDELQQGEEKRTAQGDRFKRESFLVVTNAVEGHPDAAGSWDTRKVPDGEYRVIVTAFDLKGNQAERSRTVRVRNGASD